MQTYFPISIGIDFKASHSNMISFQWITQVRGRCGAIADFRIPHDTQQCLRVQFETVEIVRLLDEMPLSTEEERGSGLVSEHFAYRVKDSRFWKSQSEALKLAHPNLEHYRFITGWTCLDVLTDSAPIITVVPINSASV